MLATHSISVIPAKCANLAFLAVSTSACFLAISAASLASSALKKSILSDANFSSASLSATF
jgi:hypothetical protein